MIGTPCPFGDRSIGGSRRVFGAGGGVGSSALKLAHADGIAAVGVASSAEREWGESMRAKFVESGDTFSDEIRVGSKQARRWRS
ncbi:hypothetical protein E5720_15555 [Rhodococcus sp. PAMC28707]|uniref:hypothetical protein n=1 Tax=unclassified Rhodococcus (in: high G+C Gram-positive bacteria) TaxID=192944 RepID=UPI00109D8F17|nr:MULTISPECIES: hypothetical protein [unclassified Rhodococcus (in: high G+C Gram-positive bacteria)]QCB52132.1 hypothetical protein E5769_19965 [Rhodococcus sp. PAMC28705]QCB59700.1 hypothetical protein E5720_15555 [Rhodococcus sp. PAMC28707]